MATRNATPLLRWGVGNGVLAISISHDVTRVASSSIDDSVRIWDVRTRSLVLGPIHGHDGRVGSVAWSHDDTRIVSGSDDKSIRIWDSQTGALLGNPLIGHINPVCSVAFSSDSTRLISGSNDGTICMWDARTGVRVGKPFRGHTGDVYSLAISQDNTRIVSGSGDHTIRMWDARTGAPIGEPLRGHTGSVALVAFSHHGTRVVSGSSDGTIRMWDAYTGVPIGEPLTGHTSAVSSMALSRNDTHIVSGSYDNTIRIWDAHTGASIGEPLAGHASYVNSVAFFPDSSRIVSGSYDGIICVWEAPQSTSLNMVSSTTSGEGIFESLVEHGCTDLASTIDSAQFTSSHVDCQESEVVRQARTNAGATVTARFLRLQPVREGGEKVVKRLTEQLQYWSKAKHDNIQELLGVVMYQDRLGMVSPWVDGSTLQEYVRETPTVNRYSLCTQVAKGVSYLHSIGMIHGDIRLFNVLISTEGVPKLNGFDSSLVFEDALTSTQTSELGPKRLRWVAPEMLRKEKENGPPVVRNKKTDVYALGMTMLEIITGRVPYSEYKFELAIYGALSRKELPQRPKELPEEDQKASRMWDILVMCWSYDPSLRLDAEDIAPAMKVFVR